MANNYVNVTTREQFDLSEIYGLKNTTENSDNINNLYNSGVPIPSLEQIAAYNLSPSQQIPGQPITAEQRPVADFVSSSNQPDNPITSMAPDISQMYSPISQQDLVGSPTPTTAVSQTATLANPITDFSNPYPVTPESIQFLNGFIRTQIGRRVSVDFLVGSNSIVTKTGYLLGATPKKQQIGEIVGVIAAALAIGGTLYLLDSAWGFGTEQLAAPQATLMKLIIQLVISTMLNS